MSLFGRSKSGNEEWSASWVQGTWTPLHADVLRSYSWSTNVVGRKRWLLLPPCHTHLLYDRFGQHMAPDFSPETVSGVHSLCLGAVDPF